jgi:hypothetical protein
MNNEVSLWTLTIFLAPIKAKTTNGIAKVQKSETTVMATLENDTPYV